MENLKITSKKQKAKIIHKIFESFASLKKYNINLDTYTNSIFIYKMYFGSIDYEEIYKICKKYKKNNVGFYITTSNTGSELVCRIGFSDEAIID